MKIVFRPSTTASPAYKTSPDLKMSDDLIDRLYEFASNAWEEVPEVDCDDNEIIVWFNEDMVTNSPAFFQKFITDMSNDSGFQLPAVSNWK